MADTCIRHKSGFFSGEGKAGEPVWVIMSVGPGKDFDEMPLITPS